MSVMFGKLCKTVTPDVASNVPAINARAAFLEPATLMLPDSGYPPSMTMCGSFIATEVWRLDVCVLVETDGDTLDPIGQG